MQRTTKKSTAVFVIALTALFSLASLGWGYRLTHGGSTQAAAPQGPFGSNDNFIFTNASLKGTYAGVLSGWLFVAPAPAPPIPTAVSYILKYDGNGRLLEGKATVNNNGQVFEEVLFAGEYDVKADGTITFKIVPSTGPLMGLTLLANGVVTETDRGSITEHRDVFHTSIVATSVVKRIRR